MPLFDDYYLYFQPPNSLHFAQDINKAIINMFGLHGHKVHFNNTSNCIYKKWCDAAGDYSLEIANSDGQRPIEKNPVRLSHIKLAGLLVNAIYTCAPIKAFTPLTDDDKAAFAAHNYIVGDRELGLIREYPNEMAALCIVGAMFDNYQNHRDGTYISDHPSASRRNHYMHNLCVLMRKEKATDDMFYMIYKTIDLRCFTPRCDVKKPSEVSNK